MRTIEDQTTISEAVEPLDVYHLFGGRSGQEPADAIVALNAVKDRFAIAQDLSEVKVIGLTSPRTFRPHTGKTVQQLST